MSTVDSLVVRSAREADRDLLASFDCPSLDEDVEPWIRNEALDLHRSTHLAEDCRLLVGFVGVDLAAVAFHERNQRMVDPQGVALPGTELVVIAISDNFRDSKLTDGTPLVEQLVEDIFADIRSRRRGPNVTMFALPENVDGQRLVARLGAAEDGRSGRHVGYLLELD